MYEIAHVQDQGSAQAGVTAVPRWLPPHCLWPTDATFAATRTFLARTSVLNSQAQEIGEHVSPSICIAYTCEESERSHRNNQDICLCSGRRYERLALDRI